MLLELLIHKGQLPEKYAEEFLYKEHDNFLLFCKTKQINITLNDCIAELEKYYKKKILTQIPQYLSKAKYPIYSFKKIKRIVSKESISCMINSKLYIITTKVENIVYDKKNRLEFIVISNQQFYDFISNLYKKEIIKTANKPRQSELAEITTKLEVRYGIYFAIIIALSLYFVKTFILISFTLICIKFAILLKGIKLFFKKKPNVNKLNEYPKYSIIVPMYKEEKVINQLVNALKNINYPIEKLDIKLAIEEEDQITINAINKINLPDNFVVIKTPNIGYKTKPKAINYAFHFIKGKYMVIYDAEDIPDKNQIIAAVDKFNNCTKNTAVLQSILTGYNNKKWISRMFIIEYLMWFNFCMRGAAFYKIFIPLGGTSNHLKVDAVEKAELWLASNVTEDLELGLKLYQMGYDIDFLNSTTQEEVVENFSSWLNQRTRWLKGYILTSFQYIKKIHSTQEKRKKFLYGFYVFCITTVISPLNYFAVLYVFYNYIIDDIDKTSEYISLIFTTLIGFYLVMFCFYVSLIGLRWNYYKAFFNAFTYPFYFFLHLVALLRATYQSIFKPTKWEKTSHINAKE